MPPVSQIVTFPGNAPVWWGAVSSITVTVCVALAVLPAGSTAAIVIVVVPIGNRRLMSPYPLYGAGGGQPERAVWHSNLGGPNVNFQSRASSYPEPRNL